VGKSLLEHNISVTNIPLFSSYCYRNIAYY